jgi:hypothetical protein
MVPQSPEVFAGTNQSRFFAREVARTVDFSVGITTTIEWQFSVVYPSAKL